LLWWALMGLREAAAGADIRVVTRSGLLADQLVEDVFADLELTQPEVVRLEAETGGQAETVLMALDTADEQRALHVWNVDTVIRPGAVDELPAGNHLLCFESVSPAMSYVRRRADGTVTEVAEKRVISNWATAGLYGFESAALFIEACRRLYGLPGGGLTSVTESYVAPLYQDVIDRGCPVRASLVNPGAVVPLGTPEELREAESLAWMRDLGASTPS
jgi:dTDP-glucose pyrophosphorylase